MRFLIDSERFLSVRHKEYEFAALTKSVWFLYMDVTHMLYMDVTHMLYMDVTHMLSSYQSWYCKSNVLLSKLSPRKFAKNSSSSFATSACLSIMEFRKLLKRFSQCPMLRIWAVILRLCRVQAGVATARVRETPVLTVDRIIRWRHTSRRQFFPFFFFLGCGAATQRRSWPPHSWCF
jgi:hypothetical protein